MATLSKNFYHIARPYALAAFEFARDHQCVPMWKAYLDTAAAIANDPAIQSLLAKPSTSNLPLKRLFEEILAPFQNADTTHFLALLALNNRLYLLPNIAEAFNKHLAALEKTSCVTLITAVQVDDGYKQTLSQALAKRLHHDVQLTCEVDDSIIAGAVLHIGDRVIDGSVRGKLTRLLEFSLR